MSSSRRPSWLRRPPHAAIAILGVVLAVAFVGGITYYSAREFTSRAADTRAAGEAQSFAQHSAYLATGDAFAGYLQMLRYADDPTLRSPGATPEQRTVAMQQLLYLNTNKLASLAIVNRAGTILASTDPEIDDLRASEAFNTTRATLGPANSDIIMPLAGRPGYVEFTAPLKDEGGAVWAILYGRADPAKLWAATLRASVDGGQNVIINNEGQFSAGVPDSLLRSSWKGVPLDNGSVRASIAGVDSICGLGPIGRDTQIDHGWNVAACLPVSLIQTEAGRAMGDQGLVTLAAAVLAIAFAALVVRYTFDAPPASPSVATTAEPATTAEAPPITRAGVGEPETIEEAFSIEIDDPEPDSAPAVAATTVVQADVDALRLIEAYERRNAALSARLRETIQARMMIAASELDSAYNLAQTEPERAAQIHARAMAELEALRERDLRAFGQELHPGLVRLGLPGALRGLAKDLAGEIELALEVDPAADSVSGGAGRVRIDASLRLVLHRALRDAIAALQGAGATAATVSIARDADALSVRVRGATTASIDPETLEAASVALAAFGATLSIAVDEGESAIEWTVAAPGVAADDDEPALSLVPSDDGERDAEEAAPEPEAESVAEDEPEPVSVVATTDWRASMAATTVDDAADGTAPRDHAIEATEAADAPTASPVLHVIPAESIDATPLSERLQAIADASPLLAMTIDVDESADARTLAGDPVLAPPIAATLVGITRAAVAALIDMNAKDCFVAAQISEGDVFFSITADTGGALLGSEPFVEQRDDIEAREGFFAISRRGDTVTLTAQVPLSDPDQPIVIQVAS